jgi:hypothetical protein
MGKNIFKQTTLIPTHERTQSFNQDRRPVSRTNIPPASTCYVQDASPRLAGRLHTLYLLSNGRQLSLW